MLSLGKTIAKLARQRQQWEKLWKAARGAAALQTDEPPFSPLREVTGFGSNPGALRMFEYVPAELEPSPALVLVLHGCTQTATSYDYGAGWSTLADRYGFVLLFPQQQSINNPKRCFNWFLPGDTTRDGGEVHSIRQMVETAISAHKVDRDRVFITGLSAGGAMTSAMLATYPELFSAGAIIAGLPYGAAHNVQEAFDSMFQGSPRLAQEWGDLVRRASSHRGPWPRISVWHGGADVTVRPVNAEQIIAQWTDVHGLGAAPTRSETVDGYPRKVWRNGGEDVIESFTITSMAHGTPLAIGDDDASCGVAGAFLLDVGISSSYHIAKFFGLTGHPRVAPAKVPAVASLVPEQPREQEKAGDASAEAETARSPHFLPIDVEAVITKALKAAGLMKSQP